VYWSSEMCCRLKERWTTVYWATRPSLLNLQEMLTFIWFSSTWATEHSSSPPAARPRAGCAAAVPTRPSVLPALPRGRRRQTLGLRVAASCGTLTRRLARCGALPHWTLAETSTAPPLPLLTPSCQGTSLGVSPCKAVTNTSIIQST
jgi:hypothetical protein